MSSIIILGAIIAGFFLLFLYLKNQRTEHKIDDRSFLMLQNQVSEVARAVDAKLGESSRIMQRQFSESAKIIRDVTQQLTKLDETNKQVVSFADQLQSLQDILKNPKQRGVLGEYYLETLLKNVLPPGRYQMQYPFKDGTIVDAVIFVQDKVIPIDSKFSLENYNRILDARDEDSKIELEKSFKQDLKNRIDETSKYVKPEEGTMDFAFMFIPAEAIYYDLLINKVGTVKSDTQDLIQYAFRDRHVIIVSPTSCRLKNPPKKSVNGWKCSASTYPVTKPICRN